MAAEASRKGVSVSQLLAEASQSESVARIANLSAPVKRLSPGTTQDSPSHGASHDLRNRPGFGSHCWSPFAARLIFALLFRPRSRYSSRSALTTIP